MAFDLKLTQKTVRNQVAYAEFAEYGTVFQGGEAVESRRLLICNWTDRYFLPQAMLPLASVGAQVENVTTSKFNIRPANAQTGETGPVTMNRLALNRLEPERHPVYRHLFAAHSREIEGLGSPTLDPNTGAMSWSQTPAPNQTANTGFAKVEVTYKTFPFPIGGYPNAFVNQVGGAGGNGSYESCRYVSVKAKGAVKSVSLPAGGSVFWEVNPRAQGQARQMIADPGTIDLPLVHLAYTWYMVPQVPVTALTMMRTVNSQIFDAVSRNTPWGFFSFPIGTVAYHYPEFGDLYYLVDGTQVIDITYHFIYNPGGWNRFLLPAAGGFVPVYRGSPSGITIGQGLGPIWNPGSGAAGPPQNNPPNPGGIDPNLRFPPGFNVIDYADLNLLFAVLK